MGGSGTPEKRIISQVVTATPSKTSVSKSSDKKSADTKSPANQESPKNKTRQTETSPDKEPPHPALDNSSSRLSKHKKEKNWKLR